MYLILGGSWGLHEKGHEFTSQGNSMRYVIHSQQERYCPQLGKNSFLDVGKRNLTFQRHEFQVLERHSWVIEDI